MHGANLGGTTNRLEDPFGALLRLALDVHLNLYNISRGVGDDNTEWVGHASGWVCADDADLGTSDTESPKATAEALKETSKGLLNLFWNQWEDWSEVDEDMVEIRVVVANDLKSIEDIVHQPVGLGN